VPSPRKQADTPASHVAGNGVWPDGPFKEDAPPEAHLLAAIAGRVQRIADERGVALKTIADQAGLSVHAVQNLVGGRTWANARSVARIECALGAQLWKNEHRQMMPPRKQRATQKVPQPKRPDSGTGPQT